MSIDCGIARYDGHSDWYEGFAAGVPFAALRARAVALAGNGPGRCLDVGCGTGRTIPLLEEAGWRVTGVDVSADQLAAARAATGADVIQADAHELPFEDDTFDAALSVLTHTDFDDPARAFAETARVLRRGGVFVYAGVHPCFASPFVEPLEDGTSLIHPGYREETWHVVSRNPESPGIRSRVGINHATLASLLNAVLAAGLEPTAFEEPGDRDPPLFLAFSAVKR